LKIKQNIELEFCGFPAVGGTPPAGGGESDHPDQYNCY